MRDGENTGSLVSECGAQDEPGREGVCSRGQRLTNTVSRSFGPFFPCPAQSAWLTPFKMQGTEARPGLRDPICLK